MAKANTTADFSGLFNVVRATVAPTEEGGNPVTLKVADRTSEVLSLEAIHFDPALNYRWSQGWLDNTATATQRMNSELFEESAKSGKMVPYGDFKTQVESIKATAGCVQPIELANIGSKKNVVVAGFTRFSAHQHLGLGHIATIHHGDLDEASARSFSMLENATSLKREVNWVFEAEAQSAILKRAGWDGFSVPSGNVKKAAISMGVMATCREAGDESGAFTSNPKYVWQKLKYFARIPSRIKDMASAPNTLLGYQAARCFIMADSDDGSVRLYSDSFLAGWIEELHKLRASKKKTAKAISTAQVIEALDLWKATHEELSANGEAPVVEAKLDRKGVEVDQGTTDEVFEAAEVVGGRLKKASNNEATKIERIGGSEQLKALIESIISVHEDDAPKGTPSADILFNMGLGMAMVTGKSESFGRKDDVATSERYVLSQVFSIVATRDLGEDFLGCKFATGQKEAMKNGEAVLDSDGKPKMKAVYTRGSQFIKTIKEKVLDGSQTVETVGDAYALAVDFFNEVDKNKDMQEAIKAHKASKD